MYKQSEFVFARRLKRIFFMNNEKTIGSIAAKLISLDRGLNRCNKFQKTNYSRTLSGGYVINYNLYCLNLSEANTFEMSNAVTHDQGP